MIRSKLLLKHFIHLTQIRRSEYPLSFLRKEWRYIAERLQEIFRTSSERYIGKPQLPFHCTLLTELHNDATTEYTIINRPKQKPLPSPSERKIYRSLAVEIPGRSEENAAPQGKKTKKRVLGYVISVIIYVGDKCVFYNRDVDAGLHNKNYSD